MKRKSALALCVAALIAAGSATAEQGPVPKGIPRLDHVFVIMMENHAYAQIAGNPQAPFINSLMSKGEFGAKLFCHCPPELNELSRSRGRFEFQ